MQHACGIPEGPCTSQVYRKKRVEAPANFVREQKTYFEEVDAFELEEESPPSKDRWMPELQQKDAIAACMHLYNKGLLQAVLEDSPEELPNDNSMCALSKDPLSHILETPQSIQSLHISESRGSLQCSKQGLVANVSVAHAKSVTKEPASDVRCKRQSHSDVTALNFLDSKVQEAVHKRRPVREQSARCKALVTPKEPYPIIVLSDDEDQNLGALHRPQSFSQSKHLSRQARELGAVRDTSQVIILDDSPVPLNKECNTHSNIEPVKCEYSKGSSSSNKVPVNRDHSEKAIQDVPTRLLAELKTSAQNVHLHQQEDQRLVEQIKKLDFRAENYIEFSTSKEHSPILKVRSPSRAVQLSTYEALLKKCGQTAASPLEEAIMQFRSVSLHL